MFRKGYDIIDFDFLQQNMTLKKDLSTNAFLYRF